jgi:HlyD family secretion protein
MRVTKYVRWSLGAAVVAVLAAIAVWPEPIEVDVGHVVRGPMRVTIDEDGQTRVHDRFIVSAPVAGRLLRIDAEPGDAIRRGVVARLLPADAPLIDARTRAEWQAAAEAARQVVGQARAERDRAAATLEHVTASARRSAGLVDAGAVSREADEGAQTAVKTAANALQAAEFAVRRAERDSQMAAARLLTPVDRGRVVDVVSPIDGVVLKRLRESECIVAAGEPLLEIGNRGDLEAVVDLLSTDAVRIRPGSPVSIEGWGGTHALGGRVRLIEPSGFLKVSALGVEEQRVNVVIDFTDPAAARELGDGYRVEARITVWQADGVVMAPVGALFRQDSGWAVFVAEEGRARLQRIEIGQRNAEAAQVISGLNAGQAVVLHPPDTLIDAARIRVKP